MAEATRHIVHKLIVEVSTNSKETGYAIKEDAAGFISGRIVPGLEELFSELERKLKGNVLSVDRLSIEVAGKNADLKSGDIDRLVCTAIERELEKNVFEPEASSHESDGEAPARVISGEQRQLNAVFYFLRTGQKPWWIPDNETMSTLLQAVSLEELAATNPEELVRELSVPNAGTFVRRLMFQLPEKVLLLWFHTAFRFLNKSQEKSIPKKQLSSIMSTASRIEWWIELLAAVRIYRNSGALSKADLYRIIRLIASEKAKEQELRPAVVFVENLTGCAISVEEFLEQNAQEKRKVDAENQLEELQKDPSGDAIAAVDAATEQAPLENAGLILLHPFLKHFFSQTGLLQENELTDPELAAHALHYLATGKEQDWEHTLQFEKFLCGIPALHPVKREVEISAEIKEAADDLLKAAMDYWTGLRSTSPELLRVEFLQREAKIIDEGHASRLVFERKTHDILLDSLPWNLGIVKLSWHANLLYVEW